MRHPDITFGIYDSYTSSFLIRLQHKRVPLTMDGANRITKDCQTHEEKLVIWTLLDTDLRVSDIVIC